MFYLVVVTKVSGIMLLQYSSSFVTSVLVFLPIYVLTSSLLRHPRSNRLKSNSFETCFYSSTCVKGELRSCEQGAREFYCRKGKKQRLFILLLQVKLLLVQGASFNTSLSSHLYTVKNIHLRKKSTIISNFFIDKSNLRQVVDC